MNVIRSVWRLVQYPILVSLLLWLMWTARSVFDGVLLTNISWRSFLCGIVVYQVGVLLLAERLRIILRCVNVVRSYGFVLRAYIESIPYYFLTPSGVGLEIARFVKLRLPLVDANERRQHPEILAALIADRLSGLFGAVVLAFLGWPSIWVYMKSHSFDFYKFLIAFVIFCILLVIIASFILYKYQILRSKVKEIVLLYLRNPGTLLLSSLYAIIIQATIGLSTYFVAKSFNVNVDVITCLWVTGAGMVLIVIPISVLGFNLLDAASPALYLMAGVFLTQASFLVLIGFLLRIWLGIQGTVIELHGAVQRKKVVS